MTGSNNNSNININNDSDDYNSDLNFTFSSTFYTTEPKDEREAHEKFRQEAIDKSIESSVVDWREHVENHDENLRRRALQASQVQAQVAQQVQSSRNIASPPGSSSGGGSGSLQRMNSSSANNLISPSSTLLSSMHDSSAAFMTVSVRSTLRKRTASSSTISDSCNNNSHNQSSKNYQRSSISGDIKEEDVEGGACRDGDEGSNSHSKQEGDSSSKSLSSETKLSPPPVPPPSVPGWEKYYNRHVQLLVSLALFSYAGEYLRYFLEDVFGHACQKPNTTYWDTSGWNICTSKDGLDEHTGGAFFIDLPVNMIGCFIMGLLVSGDGESIAINIPMAALPRSCFFQSWVVTHVGLRTGFCGSLTTFASWNTQMVQMISGGSGLYGSLESFKFGTACAYALSRYFNKSLAVEADHISDKKAIGVLINRDLPDFERRFLHDIVLNEDEEILEVEEKEENQQQEKQQQKGDGDKDQRRRSTYSRKKENLKRYNHKDDDKKNSRSSNLPMDEHVYNLRAWKETTDDHRNGKKKGEGSGSGGGGGENYVKELQEIEKNLLVDKIEPRQELLDVARDAGWDVGALRNWTKGMDYEEKKRIVIESGGNDDDLNSSTIDINSIMEDSYFGGGGSSLSTTPLWEVVFNMSFFLIVTIVLIAAYMNFKDGTDTKAVGSASQFLSALLSPLGTYSRWYLSRLNGSVKTRNWEWLPIGTFLANMIASVISALVAGIELSIPDDKLVSKHFADAIKSGYAGSLSTVSTFVAETTGLFRALPRYFWGYYYSFGSLFCALILGVCSYVWSVV